MGTTAEEAEHQVKLEPGQKFRGWQIVRKLDEGGFGQVYVVQKNGKQAAMKAESNFIEGGSAIKLEMRILKLLNPDGERPHVAHLLCAAKRKNFYYMIVTLLGDNLRTLKSKCPDEKVKPQTWARLAIQCLYSMKSLHDVGFVHRDIKPANFVMGLDTDVERARLVHILDFGLSRSFAKEENGTWFVRRARRTAEFRGTMRYCSPSVHLKQEQGRKDDIWSLIYMLIELHCGLPWQVEKDQNKLESMKMNIADTVLMSKFPSECFPIVVHLRQLDCYKRPDYVMIHKCFLDLIRRLKVKYSDPYDWENKEQVRKINAARSRPADYENAFEFFASDPLGINEAPPKSTGSSNISAQATVEDNKEIFKPSSLIQPPQSKLRKMDSNTK